MILDRPSFRHGHRQCRPTLPAKAISESVNGQRARHQYDRSRTDFPLSSTFYDTDTKILCAIAIDRPVVKRLTLRRQQFTQPYGVVPFPGLEGS